MPGQFESEERQTGGAERLAEAQAENARLRRANEQLAGRRRATGPPSRRRRSGRAASGAAPASARAGSPGTRARPCARQTDSPHRIETHWPPSCGECAAPLSAADTQGEPVRRQVFDLPQPQPLEGTEHQAYACRCRSCGSLTRAAFPEGVNAPTQYGPRIAAIAVYLQNGHFLPEERLAEIFRDLFGVVVCAATLAGMTRKAAESWRSFSERVREWIVSAAGAKHLDETGFRTGGKTQWLHVSSTPWLTFYRTSARRGSLLEGLRGCLVHDHWKPYFTVRGVLHALCNAHHLRELQALVEIDGEDWARRMQQLLRRANRAARRARERGIALPRSLLERIQRRYDQLVGEALA